MLLFILCMILFTAGKVDSRSWPRSDHSTPSFLSSVILDDTELTSAQSQHRFIHIIEYLIKHISDIKSEENFIDNILKYHQELPDKIKILKFLQEYFQTANRFIEAEPSPDLSSDELETAHKQIQILLAIIDNRLELFKSWIPPTMPFLNVR